VAGLKVCLSPRVQRWLLAVENMDKTFLNFENKPPFSRENRNMFSVSKLNVRHDTCVSAEH